MSLEWFGRKKASQEAAPMNMESIQESAGAALGRVLENLPMQGDQGKIMESAVTQAKTAIQFDSLPPQAQEALEKYFQERIDNARKIGIIGENT